MQQLPIDPNSQPASRQRKTGAENEKPYNRQASSWTGNQSAKAESRREQA